MQSERHPKVRRTKHKNIFPPLTYLPDYWKRSYFSS
jgi:hypothetical protein